MKQTGRIAALAVCLTWGSLAGAQSPPRDHLTCYKTKDPQAKTTYTADLDGLVVQPGCTIKVPAITACVPSTKINVRPVPEDGSPHAHGERPVRQSHGDGESGDDPVRARDGHPSVHSQQAVWQWSGMPGRTMCLRPSVVSERLLLRPQLEQRVPSGDSGALVPRSRHADRFPVRDGGHRLPGLHGRDTLQHVDRDLRAIHHHDHHVVQRMGRRLRHGPARRWHRDVLRRAHLRPPKSDVGLRSVRRGSMYRTVRLPWRRLRRGALLLGLCRSMRAGMLSWARVRLPELRHAGDVPPGVRLALYPGPTVQPRPLRSDDHDVRLVVAHSGH
jgi:hypothetical protein